MRGPFATALAGVNPEQSHQTRNWDSKPGWRPQECCQKGVFLACLCFCTNNNNNKKKPKACSGPQPFAKAGPLAAGWPNAAFGPCAEQGQSTKQEVWADVWCLYVCVDMCMYVRCPPGTPLSRLERGRGALGGGGCITKHLAPPNLRQLCWGERSGCPSPNAGVVVLGSSLTAGFSSSAPAPLLLAGFAGLSCHLASHCSLPLLPRSAMPTMQR